jgi:hypothetical protein
LFWANSSLIAAGSNFIPYLSPNPPASGRKFRVLTEITMRATRRQNIALNHLEHTNSALNFGNTGGRHRSHLFLYEGDSVKKSHMDIKREPCDIISNLEKTFYFPTYPPPTLIHLSHRFASESKPAARRSLLTLLTIVSATSAPGRASSSTFERF